MQGVIVPLITPYHFAEILPLIDHVASGGAPMIFLLGTTGEALKLQQGQKKELILKAASHLKNRARLLVGITSQKFSDTLELSDIANQCGALASVIAPRVLSQDCASLIEKLLSSSPGNFLLYNYPALSRGNSLPLEQVAPFMSEPRVLGIKDSSGDFAYFDALLNSRRSSHFKIYYGPEKDLQEAFKRPIDGFVPGSGNIEPGLACELWEKKENGPWKAWQELKTAIKNKNPENYILGLKLLLKERGLITDARLFGQ